jgi:hypothetical protein
MGQLIIYEPVLSKNLTELLDVVIQSAFVEVIK